MSKKSKITICWGCQSIQRIGYVCGICGNFVDRPIEDHRRKRDDNESKIADPYTGEVEDFDAT